ncbi:hypothetical protein WA538_002410 [Blastocystis sp. DL]
MFRVAEGTSLITSVVMLIQKAIATAFPSISVTAAQTLVSQNMNKKMPHDYQCNAAMGLQKRLKESMGPEGAPKNPREVAERIVASMPQNKMIAKCDISGPGFINMYLSKEWVSENVKRILTHGIAAPPMEKKRIVLDYSSPNIAKDMHVGHLRSTIIGDCLGRILEFCGHEVIRINHVGDWGTQFGMLIAHLEDIAPDFDTNPPSIEDLTVFYKQAKVKFDEDEAFRERAHQEVVNLQSGKEKNVRMWKMLCAVSERMFSKVYKMLNVDPRLKMMGESFYNPLLPLMVNELKEKGLLEDDNGAKVFFPLEGKPPLIIQKSDGGYGYDSTDMTALKYRIQEQKADWVIYVVDSGQALHFELVFAAARKAGWVGDVRLDHVGFGVVQGEDKKKFKTRAGKSVRLIDLLTEARERATAIMKQRVADGVSGLTDEKELEEAAAQLGYGGVKYFDLRQNRLNDYVFNFDRMLSPDGDTNVYLQYSHARCMSILRKAPEDVDHLKEHTTITLEHPSEWDLACYILRFSDVLEQVPDDLMPNRICKYIYDLSIKLNGFYRDCRVIGAPEQNSRLLLIAVAEKVMRQGFDLLGLVTLDKI